MKHDVSISHERRGIRFLALFLFLIGLLNIAIGRAHPRNQAFLVIGALCLFLSPGIYRTWNWTRISLITTSFLFILLVYVPLFALLSRENYQYRYAVFIGVVF